MEYQKPTFLEVVLDLGSLSIDCRRLDHQDEELDRSVVIMHLPSPVVSPVYLEPTVLKGIGRQARRHGSWLVESTRLSTCELNSLIRLVGRLTIVIIILIVTYPSYERNKLWGENMQM